MPKRNRWLSEVRQRLNRGRKYLGGVGTRLMEQHQKRTPLQRSIFTATIFGVLAGAALGAGWSVSSRMLADWQRPIQDENFVARIDLPEPGASSSLPGEETRAQASPSQSSERGLLSGGTDGNSIIMPTRPDPPQASSLRREEDTVSSSETFHPKVDAHPSVAFPETDIQEIERVMPTLSVDDMIWPVSGSITRPFGWYRHPVFGDWRYTSSIALETTTDDRSVRAALDGRVKDVVNEGGLWRVTVEHAGGLVSEYDGLVSVHVASYEPVETGRQLGTAPAPGSGRAVAFSLLSDGSPLDPQTIIDGPGLPVIAR